MGETCAQDYPNASGATPAADAGAIEWKCLEGLRAIQRKGAPDIVARVIRLYLDNSRDLVQNLADAVTAQDASLMRTVAHTLKSSSANVGATGLAGLCAHLEEMGRTGESSGAAALFSRICDAHRSVCVRLAEEARRIEGR